MGKVTRKKPLQVDDDFLLHTSTGLGTCSGSKSKPLKGRQQQAKMTKKQRKSTSSGAGGGGGGGGGSSPKFIGISQYRMKKWEAHIWAKGGTPEGGKKGKQLHLGYFNTPQSAARTYDLAALFLRGQKASLNFTQEDYAQDPIMRELRLGSRDKFLTRLRELTSKMEEKEIKLTKAMGTHPKKKMATTSTSIPMPMPMPMSMPIPIPMSAFGIGSTRSASTAPVGSSELTSMKSDLMSSMSMSHTHLNVNSTTRASLSLETDTHSLCTVQQHQHHQHQHLFEVTQRNNNNHNKSKEVTSRLCQGKKTRGGGGYVRKSIAAAVSHDSPRFSPSLVGEYSFGSPPPPPLPSYMTSGSLGGSRGDVETLDPLKCNYPFHHQEMMIPYQAVPVVAAAEAAAHSVKPGGVGTGAGAGAGAGAGMATPLSSSPPFLRAEHGLTRKHSSLSCGSYQMGDWQTKRMDKTAAEYHQRRTNEAFRQSRLGDHNHNPPSHHAEAEVGKGRGGVGVGRKEEEDIFSVFDSDEDFKSIFDPSSLSAEDNDVMTMSDIGAGAGAGARGCSNETFTSEEEEEEDTHIQSRGDDIDIDINIDRDRDRERPTPFLDQIVPPPSPSLSHHHHGYGGGGNGGGGVVRSASVPIIRSISPMLYVDSSWEPFPLQHTQDWI